MKDGLAIMYYTYILLSSKSHIFYIGSTRNLTERVRQHNTGLVTSTKPHIPWSPVWYCACTTKKEAEDFEIYLKSGSGKSFAYKRLISVVLKKDFSSGRKSRPKPKA
jgi:predicted GIY-YIG superfamily endonuclease